MPAKALPVPDDLSRAYWEGAARHELTVLRCSACGLLVHYPQAQCSRCNGRTLTPHVVSGRGTIYTFTISHYVGGPGFEGETPYVIALVELVEQPGLRIVANVRGSAPEGVRVGMPVQVTFEDVAPGMALPQFRPAA